MLWLLLADSAGLRASPKSLSVNKRVHFPSVPTGVGDGGTQWRGQDWGHG